MRRELLEDRPDRLGRAAVRVLLQQVPWSWPLAGAPLDRARELSGAAGPLPVRPGQTLLLTARGEQTGGAVWLLDLGERARGDVPVHADEVWNETHAALPGALPLLWRSTARRERHGHDPLRVLPASPPAVRRLTGGLTADLDSRVEGRSLGLSLLLAQASLLLDEPLPLDLAASASMSARGELGHVDGLTPKVLALADAAPQVTRLLVAPDDVAAAQAAVDEARSRLGEEASPIQVVPCATVGDALRLAFPELEARWRTRGADPETRHRLVAQVLHLALADRREAGDWQPVRHAARLARAHWPGLTESERYGLELAEACAARHMFEVVRVALPSAEAIASLPQPTRTAILAHLVQQATDTGFPDPAATEALALPHLELGPDAFPEHLRLLGALGRLAANTGRHALALERQLEAAEGWLQRPTFHGVSYPLSEAYRLASVLGSTEGFAHVEALHRRAEHLGVLTPDDAPWVDAPRARALLAFDRPLDARALVEPLWTGPPQLPFVSIATRVLHAAASALGDPTAVEAVESLLTSRLAEAESRFKDAEDRASSDKSQDAAVALDRARGLVRDLRTCKILISLDRALATAEHAGAEAASDELVELHQELCELLTYGVPAEARALEMCRVFPY